MVYYIYDLDGTVIDSSHRQAAKPCGEFDLEHWFENATPEKIAADKLLPLVNTMRRHYYSGEYVIICTARTMQEADFQYLIDNKIFSDAILFRPEGVNDSDADLKEYMLDEFFDGLGEISIDNVRAVIYEDNLSVIERLRSRGVLGCYVGKGYRDE